MAEEPSRLGRVLIVGATGRVGREVLAKLSSHTECRPGFAGARPEDKDHDWVHLDLLDADTFGPALADIAAVFMMRPPQMAKASLVEPFLRAARGAGIKRLVFLSVKGADKNPFLPHYGMERLIETLGFDWTHIRPGDFMQNLETEHLRSIMQRGEIAVPAGGGKSAFIDVADVGAVAAHCLLGPGHSGRGYTLTGPEALDFVQIAAMLSSALGRAIRYRHVSVPRFMLERHRDGQPLAFCLVMAAVYTVQRFGRAATTTDTVRNLLGRAPTDFAAYAGQRFAAGSPRDTSSPA